MKLKTFGKYIFVGMLFLVVVLSCVKLNTKAEATTGILYLNDESVAERSKIDENYTVPTKSGYVFGGWYNDEQGLDPMTEEEANAADTAFAKWVPDYVLSVKAQVNQNALNDDFTGSNRAAIRLLTSVDSRNYEEVGFDVVRGDYPSYTYHLDSKSVFTQVRVVGEKEGAYTDHTPEGVFGSDSHFFEAVTFKNMPETAVNTELTVTPYWITPDGTRVEGAYSIKTVNLGRSWVYIGSGETLNSEGKYGTYGHPYSDFADALESIALKETGKIYIRSNSTVQVGSDFKWTQRGYDFTILGESGTTETLDFSQITNMAIGDGVTFSKMTLKFNGKTNADGKVFANGNRLKISGDVVSNNPRTYMFGGGYSTSVKETDITLLAGQYLRVYGGGNGTSSAQGIVTGDAHITFGGTATAEYVSGAGASNSNVQGTCNVKVTGGTVTEGIYGGGTVGTAKNTDTSVIMSGGTAQQIFGGNQAGMTGNVYVEINGGTVTRRVYGGCYNNDYSSESAKSVNGHITVVIRDKADLACNLTGLNGVDKGVLASSRCTTKPANEVGILIFNDALFSKFESKVGSDSINVTPYDYLIKSSTGGVVATKNDVLGNAAVISIQPSDTERAGTLTDTDNSQVTYFKGAGVCELPSFADGQTSSVVEVDFSPTDVQSELNSCEARIEGIYYSTLEDSVAFAIERQDAPFVTLMNDANIESEFTIAKGQTLKIQSEAITEAVGENEFGQMWNTISGVDSSKDLFVVNSSGKLELNNLQLTGGKHSVYSQGTVDVNNLYIHDIGGVGIYLAGGANEVTNLKIENAERFGILVTNGQATADNVTINSVGTDGSSRYAIKCQGSGKLTITANNDAKNGVTITGMTKGGGIANASPYKIEAVGVNIEGVANAKYPIYIEPDREIEITDLNITRASGNTTELIHIASGATFTLRGNDKTKSVNGNSSAGDGYIGRGVVVNGTFNLYGGNISNNKISSGNGAGVQVKAGGTFNMYGGSVSGNTAPNGGGVSLEGTAAVAATETTEAQEAVLATFNLEGGSVSENVVTAAQANNGYGAGGGVYIINGALTMSSQSTGSISDNDGHNDGAGVYLGAGATFDMYNGSVNGNELTTYSARGGGVCVNASDAKFTLHGGNINGNIARAGGGVIIRYGEFVMNGGTISENQANRINGSAGQGGAVYVLNSKSTSVFSMNGGDITSNTAASTQGTAIFVNNGTFNWNGGTFTGYTSNNAIYGYSSPILNIKKSVYEDNKGLIHTTIKTINQID